MPFFYSCYDSTRWSLRYEKNQKFKIHCASIYHAISAYKLSNNEFPKSFDDLLDKDYVYKTEFLEYYNKNKNKYKHEIYTDEVYTYLKITYRDYVYNRNGVYTYLNITYKDYVYNRNLDTKSYVLDAELRSD